MLLNDRNRTESESPDLDSVTPLYERIPKLGLREYWYPVIESRKVRSKPVYVKILGDHIVLFRNIKTRDVYALEDRCPHRGLALSKGRLYYPGFITCAYHGWVFDGNGRCHAILTEGPGCTFQSKVNIRHYPAVVHRGVIWLWMGNQRPVDFGEDIPEEIFSAQSIFYSPQVIRANWLRLAENSDGHHAEVLHRRSIPVTVFSRPAPAWIRPGIKETEDGKGIAHYNEQVGPLVDDYPGLGLWPPKLPMWERTVKALLGLNKTITKAHSQNGQRIIREVHLPGWRRIWTRGRSAIIEWPVPIDEHTTLNFRAYCFLQPSKKIRKRVLTLIYDMMRYYLWWTWARNYFFNGQDTYAVENIREGKMMLQRNDVTITNWYKLILKKARDYQVENE